MTAISEYPTEALWAELERRGAAVHAGWCYPAMAASEDAEALVNEHGYEFGPWQLLEKGDRLAEPPSWRLFAEVPKRFQRDDGSQEDGR